MGNSKAVWPVYDKGLHRRTVQQAVDESGAWREFHVQRSAKRQRVITDSDDSDGCA